MEQPELSCLRRLHGEGSAAVEHPNTRGVKMREVIMREEYSLTVPAQIRRRAHAIEEQRKIPRARCRIIGMTGGIQLHVIDATRIEFREQRTKPIRMFVKNRQRF